MLAQVWAHFHLVYLLRFAEVFLIEVPVNYRASILMREFADHVGAIAAECYR